MCISIFASGSIFSSMISNADTVVLSQVTIAVVWERWLSSFCALYTADSYEPWSGQCVLRSLGDSMV